MSLKETFKPLDESNFFAMQELHRRLYLSRFIYVSFFKYQERETANKHYSNIVKISELRDLTVVETIVEISDTGICLEDIFLEQNLEYLIQVAYYLYYGNTDLEIKATTPEQRFKASAKAAEIIGKVFTEINSNP